MHQKESLEFVAGEVVLLDWHVANEVRGAVVAVLTDRDGVDVPGELVEGVGDGLVRVTLPADARGLFRLTLFAETTLAVDECEGVEACAASASSTWARVILVE